MGAAMTWITTVTGCVNSRYVTQIIHDDKGSILILVDGTKVRSPLTYDVIDGKLTVAEPLDDDSDDSCPF
jgi:hypothetical protein